MRCTSTGMASAASPTRNAGVRNAISPTNDQRLTTNDQRLPYAHQTFTARQVAEKRPVERFGRVQQSVVNAVLGKLRRQRLDVRPDQRSVFIPQRLRHDRNLLAALEILKARRIVVAEIEL